MSDRSRRALARSVGPSLFILAASIVGLFFGSYWQYVLAISISSAVIGAALAMIVSYARCITIATGAMMAIGAYAAALPVLRLDVPFLLALLFATALGGFSGVVLALPGVRFRSHNLAMVTFVFQAVVIIVLRESKALTGGAEGLRIPAPVIFGYSFTNDGDFLLLCGLLAAFMVLPIAVLLEGALGKNLRAVASNEDAARAFGIDVRLHLITAFAWSSAAIAFAGALMAPRFRIIDPDSYGILASIFALAYPIVGGMGSIWGGLLGGAVLRLSPEILRPLADYIELIFCVMVVATITFCPDGFASIFTRWFVRPQSRRAKPYASRESIEIKQIARDLGVIDADVGQTGRTHGPIADQSVTLRIEDLSKSFGALRAVSNVSLSVSTGRIHGLMGPNGAGKTTVFNVISGFIRPDQGGVYLGNRPLHTTSVESRIALGVSRTFQHAAAFQRISCLDNVLIGLGRNSIWQATMRSVADAFHASSAHLERHVGMAALDAVGLADRAGDQAASLSFGDQRRLEIARAIVSRPKIILLDEPVAGVTFDEAHRLRELLLTITRELGTGMIVIEHNISFLVSLCERISVMSEGAIIAEGEASVVVHDPRVRRAYFGEQETAA
jgi:ABC-type branched-subunit amino acid transport system ATPase component/ABC-type branched-subunit amino acid transport system permease subunit